MTNDALAIRLDFARELCLAAGAIAVRAFRRSDLNVSEKGLHDLVTQADLDIDHFLRASLAAAFPEDGIVSEESEAAFAADAGIWVIDPIDGSQNFAHGIAHFAISVAFVCEGSTQLGIVHDPIAGEMFTARKGHGVWCNDEPIRVRDTRRPDHALIDLGHSTNLPNTKFLGLLDRVLGESFAFLQQGSAALGLAQVACGRVDGFAELHLYSWDVLAGLLLVEEAGGWTSEFDAQSLKGGPVMACTPGIREPLARACGIR